LCKSEGAAGQTKNFFFAFFLTLFFLSSYLPQPAKKQALEVIKELQKTMKIERAQMKLMIRLPKASAKSTKAKIEPMITSVGARVPIACMRQASRWFGGVKVVVVVVVAAAAMVAVAVAVAAAAAVVVVVVAVVVVVVVEVVVVAEL
jgi:hypothetical protein